MKKKNIKRCYEGRFHPIQHLDYWFDQLSFNSWKFVQMRAYLESPIAQKVSESIMKLIGGEKGSLTRKVDARYVRENDMTSILVPYVHQRGV